MKSAADVFKGARAVLEARGLHKGSYFKERASGSDVWPPGPCDLYGALFLGAGLPNNHDARSSAWNNYYKWIQLALPPDTDLGPGKWQDQPHIELKDVLALYDRAIALVAVPAEVGRRFGAADTGGRSVKRGCP